MHGVVCNVNTVNIKNAYHLLLWQFNKLIPKSNKSSPRGRQWRQYTQNLPHSMTMTPFTTFPTQTPNTPRRHVCHTHTYPHTQTSSILLTPTRTSIVVSFHNVTDTSIKFLQGELPLGTATNTQNKTSPIYYASSIVRLFNRELVGITITFLLGR